MLALASNVSYSSGSIVIVKKLENQINDTQVVTEPVK